jgi:hypothetical protein
MIGKLEELTLMAALRAGSDSHAAKIFAVMEDNGVKGTQFAAVYTTLDRMAKKGFFTERTDATDPRSKRLFTITGEGRKALDEAVNATAAVGGFTWAGTKGVRSNG